MSQIWPVKLLYLACLATNGLLEVGGHGCAGSVLPKGPHAYDQQQQEGKQGLTQPLQLLCPFPLSCSSSLAEPGARTVVAMCSTLEPEHKTRAGSSSLGHKLELQTPLLPGPDCALGWIHPGTGGSLSPNSVICRAQRNTLVHKAQTLLYFPTLV